MVEALKNVSNSSVQQLLENQHAHILYMYQDHESYLKQILSFIEEGIAADDYVVIIENERNYHLITKELENRLTEKDMNRVQYLNSMNFYLSSGSYSPSAIQAHFMKTVQWYLENEVTFRSWAHVEWATLNGPNHLIKENETLVDEVIQQLGFSLICAYEKNRLPDELYDILQKTHPYVLDDKGLNKSKKYTGKKETKQ